MSKNYLKKINLVLFLLCIFTLFISLLKTPSYKTIRKKVIGSDQFLLDQEGQIIQSLRTNFNKRQIAWLPLNSYSKDLQKTIIKIEDKRFYYHPGIDPLALLRAIRSIIIKHRMQGGSTITMQLSDLIDDSVLIKNKKIIKGVFFKKLIQIYKAIFIELKWSKREILEAYLNLIHLKGEHQGIQSFTQAYLNKSPHYLNMDEILVIGSLIREPNSTKAKLITRACYNNKRLHHKIKCENIKNVINTIYTTQPKIEKKYESAPHLARTLFKSNRRQTYIKSFIDSKLQKKVNAILKKNLSYLQKNNVSDIAAIVIDNKTGHILSYIGTIDKFSKSKNVDGVDSPRQAGSTLKPFLYAKALDLKLVSASSILTDEPTVLPWSGGIYRPTNYDSKFHGDVTLRQALASSLNVPAIKIVKILGLTETYSTIKSLQFSNLKNPDFYGASIALGAVEVKLHELANAYRAIANEGILTPLLWAQNDKINLNQNTIMSKETAFIIKSILSDTNARKIGFGWDSALETSFWSAVKTGTSKGLRDNWCIGFSELYTVGVWAGNFSSDPMKGVSGVSGAAPSWYEIINYLHSHKKSVPPLVPKSIVAKEIQFDWKMGTQTEYYIKGTEPLNSIIGLPKKTDISITFPASKSVLTIDPHKATKSDAIFVRYKGTAPKNSQVYLNNEKLGPLTNPFKISPIRRGKFNLQIMDSKNQILDKVSFEVK